MSHFTTGQVVTAAELNSLERLATAEVTSGTAASLQLNVPSGIDAVRIVGVMRSDDGSAARDTLGMTLNGITTTSYRVLRMSWLGNSATPSQSFSAGATAWNLGAICAAGLADTTVIFGSVEILLLFLNDATRTRMQWSGGVTATSVATEATHALGSGHIATTATITTVEFFPVSTANWIAGTRFDLYSV